MLQKLSISLANVLYSEICLPLIDILSPAAFTHWGIHTERNELLFYVTLLSPYTSDDQGLSSEPAPVYVYQVPLTIFNGTLFPGLLLWLVSFRHAIGGEGLLQWAVRDWKSTPGFIWSVVSIICQWKPEPLTVKGHPPHWSLMLHTALLQVFICLRSTLEYSRFLFYKQPFLPRNGKPLFDESVITFEYILFSISELLPLVVK